MNIVWKRTYRSRNGPNGALGAGWDYTYNVRLEAAGGNLRLHNGAGRQDILLAQGGGEFASAGLFTQAQQNPDGSYRLTFPDTGAWGFAALDGSPTAGRLTYVEDRNGNRVTLEYDGEGRLTRIRDTQNDPNADDRTVSVTYDSAGRISTITDWAGREVRYAYYQPGEPGGSPGDLKSATTPPIVPTSYFPVPPEHVYPDGKTTVYTYTTGHADERLNHLLLTVTDAKGQTYVTNVYHPTTDPYDPNFGRVVRQVLGNPGESTEFVYVPQTPEPGNSHAVQKTIVNDRVGNVSEYFYDQHNRLVMRREYTGRATPGVPTTDTANRPTGKLRADDPDYFETRLQYNNLDRPVLVEYPNGNYETYVYDEGNPDPRARGNLLEHCLHPGPLGGDQPVRCESFEYLNDFGGCCGTSFLTRAVDFRGHETRHEYDARGNRIRTQHRIPTIVEEWEYNAEGQPTAHVLPDNGSGHRRRDETVYYSAGPQRGHVYQEILDVTGLALTTTYEYDVAGNPVRTINPRGHDTQRVYNQLNQVVREYSSEVVPGVRYQTDYFYDANNNLARTDVVNVDESGQLVSGNPFFTTIRDYDILNMVVRTCTEKGSYDVARDPPQLTCAGLPPGEFIMTEYEYDANRNRTRVRSAEAINGNQPANTAVTEYDERGLVYREIRAAGDPDQSSTQHDYDGNRNRTRLHTGLEDAPHITTFAYDGYNRQTSSTDPMGNVLQYHYDANGNRTTERIDGELLDIPGTSGNVRLAETTYTYDAMNRLVRTDRAFFDPVSQLPIGDGQATTLTTYTDNSQVAHVTNDNNHTTSVAYDTANRRLQTTDAAGNTVTYLYDAGGNVLQMVEVDRSDLGGPDQSFTTTYTYDALNRRITVTDNIGNERRTYYDSRNNETRRVDALGRETRFFYDGVGRLVCIARDVDGDGADPNDPDDANTFQEWDDNSRLRTQTDDNGNVTAYYYDALDRKTVETYADGKSHLFTYDVHDNQLTTLDSNGSVTQDTYDANDRRIGRLVFPAPGVSGQTSFELYAYDGLSRLVRAENDQAQVERTYDSLSQIRSERANPLPPFDPNDVRVTVTLRDGVGNVHETIYPGGRVIQTWYDVLERKSTITDADTGLIAAYSYVGPARVERRDYGNGTRTEYTYDGITGVPNPVGDFGVRQIIRTRHTRIADGLVIDDRVYHWDAVGNKVSREDIRAGGPRLRHVYTYDALDRLVATTVSDQTDPNNPVLVRHTGYDLDGVGNRRQVTGAPDPGLYVMDPNVPQPADYQMNQYSATPFDVREYDQNGNLIWIDRGLATERAMAYDYANRMVSFSDAFTGVTALYRYDALGRRIEKSVAFGGPPEVTRFFYDGWQELEEQDGAGATRATYVYGLYIDEVLNMRQVQP